MPSPAHASDWWLHMGGVSGHRSSNPRKEENWGAGLEYRMDREWAFSAGSFSNSFFRRSKYALVNWTPVVRGPLRLGLTGGVVTGYHKKKLGLHGQAMPVVLPTMDVTLGHVSVALLVAPPTGGNGAKGSVMAVFKVGFDE